VLQGMNSHPDFRRFAISVARMGRRDAMGMPPLGSSLPDSGGIAVISDWINQLTSCQ